jgi:tRNA threonylcarbamoyl adenosine modification protein YjeE
LDLVIDVGTLPKRDSSTVVDTTLVGNMVLRQGDINLGNKSFKMISESEEETMKLAETLVLKHWKNLRQNGLMFGLTGELGVGKTIFAKGVGKFLKINDEITSPSYTLANEYEWEKNEIKGKFFHLDPWRLENFDQFIKLGIEDMTGENNLVIVEWASKYVEDLEKFCSKKRMKMVKVYFSDLGSKKRKIEVVD